MKKTIFHGSSSIIEKPVFGAGKKYNDYGMGFYCTQSLELAKEWAVGRASDGYANTYLIDESDLSMLDLNSPDFTILHWLAVLLKHRTFDITSPLANEAKSYLIENFSVPVDEFDVITGYRADDSYFSFAQDFINGTISVRQLANAMKLGNLGTQYVLKSQKAFNSILFTGYEKVEKSEWFCKKESRDKEARRKYFDIEKNKRQKGDVFVVQLLDGEIKSDDPRLR